MKTYSEMIRYPTFDERLKYLYIGGGVAVDTFGYDRYLNQIFYKSPEWKDVRREIILRDNGCDLGMKGYEILDKIYIHHIVPITKEDIIERRDIIFDPNNLVCVSFDTHNKIHYGIREEIDSLMKLNGERRPNDTLLW